MKIIRKIAIYILLTIIYSFTYLVAMLGSIIPRRSWKPTGRIIVTGTFHNPNWYLSHVTPLSRSGVEEVILVVDEPQLPLERVRFVCPPRWISRLLSRAGAKAIWMIAAGFRYRPDLYMGYHIVPGACSALVAGKLLGRPSFYQMTAGPIEIIGSSAHGISSKLIQTLSLAVVKLFDLIVVRGKKAKGFLSAQDIKGSVTIITGSVNGRIQSLQDSREIDLIFVGRLDTTKQIDQFITIVDAVKHVIPNVRAAIVGDGPLMASMKSEAGRLGLMDNIEFLGKRKDVEAILVQSKVFVLTSKSEGLSIAMAEAMAFGVVPVVADVGELSDLVSDAVNGYLITPNHINEYTNRVLSLLRDDSLWAQHSHYAIEAARKYCDIDVVTGKWKHYIRNIVAQASGHYLQDVLN